MLPFPARPADTGADGKGSPVSAPDNLPARLPDRPSPENLRKQAKGLARREGLGLAAAQHQLARHNGFADWAAMMRAVAQATRSARSPLSEAAARGDVAAVRALLADGAAVDGAAGELDSPLYLACCADAPAEDRIAIARMLIEAGAFTRRGCTGGATPLHAAARRGPGALVELLLRNGADATVTTRDGDTPVELALRLGHSEVADMLKAARQRAASGDTTLEPKPA